MITIKEYLKQVLSDIRELKDEEVSVMGVRGVIEFDIATVATEELNGKIKVGVWGIGGDFGGKGSNEVSSRVKFSIQTKGAIDPGSSFNKGYVGPVTRK